MMRGALTVSLGRLVVHPRAALERHGPRQLPLGHFSPRGLRAAMPKVMTICQDCAGMAMQTMRYIALVEEVHRHSWLPAEHALVEAVHRG